MVVLFLFCIVTSIRGFSQLKYGNESIPRDRFTEEFATGGTANGMTSPFVNYLPLSVGDPMPDISFKMLNYSTPTAKISDFKGKLIILDFWATWCGSCINKLPKLDSLQNNYQDRIQIILVNSINTGDNYNILHEFFKKRGLLFNNWKLITAVNDSIADILFPHSEVPHYAWINQAGIVCAITGSSDVTMQNIDKFLTNNHVELPSKKDFLSDRLMDIGQGEATIDDNLSYYSIFKKGRLDNLGQVNQFRFIKNKNGYGLNLRGTAMRNICLLDMYKEAVTINSDVRNLNVEKRIIIESRHKDRLSSEYSDIPRDLWEKENTYTYDLVIPKDEEKNLSCYMIRDLNQYTDFYGRFEKRKIKCLALVRTSKIDKIKTRGGRPEYTVYNNYTKKTIRNMAISKLILMLDESAISLLPLIDETGYSGKVDLDFSGDVDNVADIRQSLIKYDIDLVEKELMLDVFVISDKPHLRNQ